GRGGVGLGRPGDRGEADGAGGGDELRTDGAVGFGGVDRVGGGPAGGGLVHRVPVVDAPALCGDGVRERDPVQVGRGGGDRVGFGGVLCGCPPDAGDIWGHLAVDGAGHRRRGAGAVTRLLCGWGVFGDGFSASPRIVAARAAGRPFHIFHSHTPHETPFSLYRLPR